MMILTICLLTLLASGGRGRSVPSCCPESQSPSGGPSNNPSATVCHFRRNSLKIECIKGARKAVCNAKATSQTSETATYGPTPRGEYLIGKLRNNNGVEWFNLYPKKEDNSGYYGYWQATRTGRSTMGLHPGRVSLGCVTVDASDTCYTANYRCYNTHHCWQRIRSLVNQGSMSYRGSSYSGILYVTR